MNNQVDEHDDNGNGKQNSNDDANDYARDGLNGKALNKGDH